MERSEESPVLYRDHLMVVNRLEQLMNKVVELTEPKKEKEIIKVDIKEAQRLCGRSSATIRKWCDAVGIGQGGSHLFNKEDVLRLKR